jgi:hypothetical protein
MVGNVFFLAYNVIFWLFLGLQLSISKRGYLEKGNEASHHERFIIFFDAPLPRGGKFYIGSSVNLSKRFRDYYSIRFLEKEIKKNNSIIYRSLFKHGYSSFSLEIIEYCDKSEIISREQYYIDQLN